MIRVIIERRCKPNKDKEMENLLIEFRGTATQQRGYVSGETLRAMDDPTLWLVISTWVDADLWKVWETSPERHQLQKKLEPLLTAPDKVTVCSFFRHGGAKSAHTIDK